MIAAKYTTYEFFIKAYSFAKQWQKINGVCQSGDV